MSVTLSAPYGYKAGDLVFNDNFSGTSLSANSWLPYITSARAGGTPWNANGSGGSGIGSVYDADYDLPQEVWTDNGLTLNAERQSVAGVDNLRWVTFPVTAGVVSSYGKMEFDGGYLQISMKAPAGDGAWPTLMLLPGSGARSGDDEEIDIQEGGMTGSGDPNQVFAYHIHTPDHVYGGQVNTGVDLTQGYNTYAINWIPGQSITWYLNGQAIAEITSAEAPIPDEPMELVMANQVADSAASAWHTVLDGSTPASMQMDIADVQLYQAPGAARSILGANVGGSRTASLAPVPPTVAVADRTLSVTEGGGTVALGISVTAPAASTSTLVTIEGLPAYETVTDALDHKTFAGDKITLTKAQVDSGLTLTSSYRGDAKPTALLTIYATDTIAGVQSRSATQTLIVVDPPASKPAPSADALAKLIAPPSTGGESAASSRASLAVALDPGSRLAAALTSPVDAATTYTGAPRAFDGGPESVALVAPRG
ncbi:beta-glucanase (GH16 family) [Roseiarcus fermentans]|uniref:Beta-glucanase (GH16 family) n=1 Tax=Roseiarcus fermentans TaxID=1473586 RepID=A0A366EZH3_9HYPH|nr:family 16 glycosylhydrolase [Roseiarcus fermentans]RBP07120.1 beta-glucanase (GH16 family) [Roseiarcus fermentans]